MFVCWHSIALVCPGADIALLPLSFCAQTREGECHEMCGVLPFRTKMVPNLKLAYCIVSALVCCCITYLRTQCGHNRCVDKGSMQFEPSSNNTGIRGCLVMQQVMHHSCHQYKCQTSLRHG